MKQKNDPAQAINDNKPVDQKKLILRFAAFVIALSVGVAAVIIGISSANRLEEGLQTVEAELDKDLPLFQSGISFRHWFSGSSQEIRLGLKELNGAYSDALKDAHRLLDPEQLYEGWVNLATLNQNQGREIVVSAELYGILRQADDFTRRGTVYNVFAGALYAEWESLRYQLEPADTDPASDPEEARRLELLTAATRDLSNFSLEFLDDARCALRFTVSQSYLKLLDELELNEAPILDLNVLYDAFKLQLTAERLRQRGYDRGYLSTESGLTLTLSAYRDGGSYALYGPGETEALPAAGRPVTGGSCAAFLRAFALEDEAGYYSVTRAGESLLRHPWLPADGDYREVLLSALVVGEGKSLPETCYACLSLYAADSPAAAKEAAGALNGFETALLLREAPKTVFVTDEAILPDTANGYAAEPIS